MPISGYRMTEFGLSHRVHKLCTSCTLIMCLVAGPGQAGPAWELFQARCLDPFEHQAEPVVDGLQQMGTRTMVTLAYLDGAGRQLIVDAAPVDGLRSCTAAEAGTELLDPAYLDWVQEVTRRQLYVPEDGMLVSAEWVEPQVHVEATLSGGVATYRVLETDLES